MERATAGANGSAPALIPNAGVVRWATWLGFPIAGTLFLMAGRQEWAVATRVLVERTSYALPVLLTVLLGLVAAGRSTDLERRYWLLLSLANAALFLCEVLLVIWLLMIDPAGPPRVSWGFRALHGIAAVALIGALASMTRLGLAAFTARLRYALDIFIFGTIAYVFALAYYVRPVMEPSGAELSHVLAGAVYPVAAVMMLLGTIANIAGFKVVKWRSWEKLAVVAIAVYIVGMGMWPMWYAGAAETSRNEARGALDLVQMTGHYLLMMAAVYRLTEHRQWALRPLPPLTLTRNRWFSAAVPIVSLIAVGFIAAVAFAQGADGRWALTYSLIGATLTCMAITRSTLLALEHSTLFYRSITDPLTGAYNHRFFHDRLAEEARAAQRLNERVALVVLDIDDFGMLNAAAGHAEGDRMLSEVADRIRSMVRPHDIVARIGGDEFAVIIPDVTVSGAVRTAQGIVDRIGIEAGPEPGRLTISTGLAILPDHAATTEELFRLADCAMLAAKSRGKNRLVVFEPGRVSDLNARERIAQLETETRLASVKALAAAVDARDADTRNHSQSVSYLAVRLALTVGLDDARAHLIGTAALLHDVGKIGIPDALLSKRGPLEPGEFLKIAEHPVMGERILSSTNLHEILPWVRGHHERWDGTGYPDGLAAESIPVEARILSLCDAYDTMTSERPYRSALSVAAALQEIDLCMGTQFDPDLAEIFIRMMSSDTLDSLKVV